MTIPFFGAPGDFFNAVGKMGLLIKNVNSFQATLLISMTNTSTGVVAQLNNESDIQAIMGDSYISLLSSLESPCSTAQQLAVEYLNRLIFRDNPQLNQTLTQDNTEASYLELIRQMKVTGNTVLGMTVTATPVLFTSTVSNIGDGTIVVSTKRPSDGLTLENAFTENLLFTCTGDSYNGSATANNEPFLVTGAGNQNDLFAFNWPLGSNCQIGINVIDPNSDNAAGNILTNSGFEDWTSNTPDNWEITTGAAGTNIFQENSIIYDGTASLRLTGDAGGTLTAWRQIFNSSSGTSGTLDSQNQYAFNVWARRDGIIPAAGVLVVELVDSNGNVILDQNSVANTVNIDLTLLNTIYTAYNIAFRTPAIMPSTYYIRYRLSTALTDTRSVYLDSGGLGLMTQTYTTGPYVAIFAGTTPFLTSDYSTCQITNSRGTAGTLNTWQTAMARLFPDMAYGNGYLLPSSTSAPTVSDNLIG